MADKTTTAKDQQAEIDRLRQLLEDQGVDPDATTDATHGIVGNLADLQRLGKLAVSEGKTNVDDAVVKPASVDADSGQTTPAETVSGNPPPEQT